MARTKNRPEDISSMVLTMMKEVAVSYFGQENTMDKAAAAAPSLAMHKAMKAKAMKALAIEWVRLTW